LSVAALFTLCCGYRPLLTGHGGVKSVRLDPVENTTSFPGLSAEVARGIAVGLRSHDIEIVAAQNPDGWRLSVQVSGLHERVSSMSAVDGKLLPVDSRWTMEGRMSITSQEGKVVVFQEAVEVSDEAPVTGDLRAEEIAADRIRARLAEMFARWIVTRVLEI